MASYNLVQRAIIEAAREGNLVELRRIKENDSTPQDISIVAREALMNAICDERLEVMRSFKEWGHGLDDIRANDRDIIRLAVARGCIAVLKLFYEWGVTADDIRASSLLSIAIGTDRAAILNLFWEWGINLEDIKADDYRCFKDTMECGHVNILRFFRDKGLQLQEVKEHINDILTAIAEERALSVTQVINILQFLNEWGVTAQDTQTVNNSIINFALNEDEGTIELLLWLQDWGVSISHIDLDAIFSNDEVASSDSQIDNVSATARIPRAQWTLYNSLQLRMAVARGDIQTLKRMDDVTTNDLRIEANLLLTSAVQNGHEKIIIYLREHGLTLKDVRYMNNLCLRTAVHNGSIPMIVTLKAFGLTYADVTSGILSPLTIAQADNNPVILQFLQDWQNEELHAHCELAQDTCQICGECFLQLNSNGGMMSKTILLTACGHIFDRECILKWIETQGLQSQPINCPLDRIALTSQMNELHITDGTTFEDACQQIQTLLQPSSQKVLKRDRS